MIHVRFDSSTSGARTIGVSSSMALLTDVRCLVPTWWQQPSASRRSIFAHYPPTFLTTVSVSSAFTTAALPTLSFSTSGPTRTNSITTSLFLRPHTPTSSLTSRPPVFRRASGTCVFRHSSARRGLLTSCSVAHYPTSTVILQPHST